MRPRNGLKKIGAHTRPVMGTTEEVIRLSPRDWTWLLELMGKPAKPNARLKAAMKRYEMAKRGAVTSFTWEP